MADTPLFEQSQETTPGNLSDRLAYGRVGVPTKNITWTNIVAWLNTTLAFLKSSNNLSDVDDVAVARTNLDVLDSTTINDAFDLKADKTNVLEKDNTTSYTPTQDYHPATGLFVNQGGDFSGWDTLDAAGNTTITDSGICQFGSVVMLTGVYSSPDVGVGDTIMTIPSSFGTCTKDWYFLAGSRDSEGEEVIELYIPAGTRNIKLREGGNTPNDYSFNTSYPVK